MKKYILKHEVFECLNPLIYIYADIPSPEIVAAQGALVSVGSSYVTYIDKKGQVRDIFVLHAC